MLQFQSSLQQLDTSLMDLTSRCMVLAADEDTQSAAVQHLEACVIKAEQRIHSLERALEKNNDGRDEEAVSQYGCRRSEVIGDAASDEGGYHLCILFNGAPIYFSLYAPSSVISI